MGQPNPTNDPTHTVNYTVTFSKPVTDFTKSDVVVQMVEYHLIDLGTLGGTSSYSYAINNSGQVVGQAGVAGQSSSITHMPSDRRRSMKDRGLLSTLAGADGSTALGISDSGQVVGVSDSSTTNSSGVNPYRRLPLQRLDHDRPEPTARAELFGGQRGL